MHGGQADFCDVPAHTTCRGWTNLCYYRLGLLQGQVAEGTKQLVVADAKSRREMLGVYRDPQDERSRLDQSWEKLHQQRRSDSVRGSLIPTTGTNTAGCLLLISCRYAQFAAHSQDATPTEINSMSCNALAGHPIRAVSVQDVIRSSAVVQFGGELPEFLFFSQRAYYEVCCLPAHCYLLRIVS